MLLRVHSFTDWRSFRLAECIILQRRSSHVALGQSTLGVGRAKTGASHLPRAYT